MGTLAPRVVLLSLVPLGVDRLAPPDPSERALLVFIFSSHLSGLRLVDGAFLLDSFIIFWALELRCSLILHSFG